MWKVRCIINNTAYSLIIILYDFGCSNYSSNFIAFCFSFLKIDWASHSKGKRCGPRTTFSSSLIYAMYEHWLVDPYRIITLIYGWECPKVCTWSQNGSGAALTINLKQKMKCSLLCAFAKLRSVTVSFVMSVCLSGNLHGITRNLFNLLIGSLFWLGGIVTASLLIVACPG